MIYIDIAKYAGQVRHELLSADDGAQYDRIIEINLSQVDAHSIFKLLKSVIQLIFFTISLNLMSMAHLHPILHTQSVDYLRKLKKIVGLQIFVLVSLLDIIELKHSLSFNNFVFRSYRKLYKQLIRRYDTIS